MTHPISPENVAPAIDWIALSGMFSVLRDTIRRVSLATGISPLILSKEAYSPNRPPENRVLEGGNLVLGEVE